MINSTAHMQCTFAMLKKSENKFRDYTPKSNQLFLRQDLPLLKLHEQSSASFSEILPTEIKTNQDTN